ncbi:hypothetical protein A1OE_148 [Candidatus Endolissoclinum faulkneri L2]|uniref:Uncharacterized protein n=1 Tax=Candidatus Endolissoclinum faulkneri L2 TaxID=1193729 RepID=K7YLI7_9PROT|nr:hypothetical protein A1OE_148 [Candidatus Endolissoclinum faulkneri L2]
MKQITIWSINILMLILIKLSKISYSMMDCLHNIWQKPNTQGSNSFELIFPKITSR